MSVVVAFLLAAAPAVAPAALERDAASQVRQRFEQAGRSVPADDPKLFVAARALARRALEKSASDAAGLLAVTEAVSSAGGWDASPTAILIKATPGQLLEELDRQKSLANEPASVLGVGVAQDGPRAALCVLLGLRKLELDPVPRHFKKAPKEVQVCGALAPPLETAELFVTHPSGAVARFAMNAVKQKRCAAFRPVGEGRSAVEVLGKGPRGPEVAALFFLDVGAAIASADQQVIEPATLDEGRRAVLARVNGLRRTMSVSPVRADPALDAIAQAWATRLATEGFFAHVDPQGGDLKGRLKAAKYRFQAAGENLGASTGPLAAHFGIEHSPGHRLNLLEPDHRALGVGITRREDDGLTVLVEVLASPLDDGGDDPVGAVYQALDELRQKRALKPLKRSPVLEALAQEHARRCLSRDLLKVELPDGRKLHEKVFEAVADAKEASVDLAIVDAPSLVPASKNLADGRYQSVGVGLVRGDSEKYGADKLWLVVIYANQGAAD
jgi:uncharacterized protein YkwD